MWKQLIAAIAFVIPTTVLADEIVIHGVTWHGAQKYDAVCSSGPCDRSYNAINPGITYVYSSGLMIGAYYNSYFRTSVYVAYRHMFNDNVGVFGGWASGYSARGSGGFVGGLVARTNDLGGGWRVGVAGQPIQSDQLDAVVSVFISKDLK